MSARPGGAAIAVFIAFALVAGSTFALARRVVSQEEQRLLAERSVEVGAQLSSSVTSIDASLHSLGTLAPLPQASTAFLAAATPLVTGLVRTVALVSRSDRGYSLQVEAGDSSSLGGTWSAERLALLRSAFTEPDMVTAVLHDGYRRRIGFALALPPDQGGLVVYQEDAIDPTDPVLSPLSATINDLQVALYANDSQSSRMLVVATGAGRAIGPRYALHLPVGAGQWTLVAQATRPLAGSFPAAVPWLLLTGGVVSAVLAAAVLEVLARRRDYALTLVDQRSAELEQSHEQLVRSERLAAVGLLAASVGHELRNPIAVISNSLYLISERLNREGITDDRIARQVTTANRELATATLIVADLVDWSRERPPLPTSVDIGELLDEVLEASPPPAEVKVVWHAPDPPRLASCDRDQVRQILLNLMSNAYDALPSGGGTVHLTVEGADDQVNITVADDGAGMTQETRTKAFEPFFTTKSRGIGLGLAVTKRLLDANHGAVDVQSFPDHGTTVRVSLPTAEPRPPRPS